MGAPELRGVGFWFTKAEPELPRPKADHDWNPELRKAVLQYLRSGHHYETYRSWEWCRFHCGADGPTMGHSELTDGFFVWPEGLAHYVDVHDVELPREFTDRAMSEEAATPAKGPVSLDWWIAWSRKRSA